MHKIVVMNGKGGCGKTTISTNIASYYAANGFNTALFDHDPQGSSMQWLARRPEALKSIYGVAAYEQGKTVSRAWQLRATRAWQLTVPPEIERVVVDTPAGLKGYELSEHLKGVDAIVIPVVPCAIDIGATANFLRELLLAAKVNTRQTPIYIVPNRVKPRTNSLEGLERFLAGLNIPVLGYLRDTVNYVYGAELGMGVYELPVSKADQDRVVWDCMMARIDSQLASFSRQSNCA